MKIKILGSASQDLVDGFWFYESQVEGIGQYCLDTLYSEIEDLKNDRWNTPHSFRKLLSNVVKEISFRSILSSA